MTDKVVFWGLGVSLILLPLPYGAVDEWAVFAFEAATFVLFILHVLDKKPAKVPPRAADLPRWLKALPVGALAVGGWSVGTVKLPKCASTREPPGKSMSISIFNLLLLFGSYNFPYAPFDAQPLKKLHIAQSRMMYTLAL